MFYAEGDSAAREGGRDQAGYHPAPGPAPRGRSRGVVEKALGAKRTDELAIMWDNLPPLRPTALWRDIDKPEYALSWNSGQGPRRPGGVRGGAALFAGHPRRGGRGRPSRRRPPGRQRSRLPGPAGADRRGRARLDAGEPAPTIDYTDEEQEVWRTVCRELGPKYERYARPRLPRRLRRASACWRTTSRAARGGQRLARAAQPVSATCPPCRRACAAR